MAKAALRVEAADDFGVEVSDGAWISFEPWSTYVPNFLVLCSTVAPVILQSGAVHVSSTQSASVQLAIDFGQNMSFAVERKATFC